MENSINFAHPGTKISRLSCKDVKKQDSLRCHMVSGFLAMVEMVHALRSLWEVFFPFVLLWWNVMLCATCARYYSWNRSRFRLQCGGHQFHGEVGESTAEVTREKHALPFHPSGDASHEEMTVITGYHGRLLTQASCVGSDFLQQTLPSTQESICDMFSHEEHFDDIVMSAKEHDDNQDTDYKSQDSIMCSAPVSKALEVTLPSGTSKLFFLHLPDERVTQQSGLLKAAYWAACPFLLPQQVVPLAMDYVNRNFIDGTDSSQLLYNMIIDFSTLEEHLQISAVNFVSRVLSMVHGKEHAYFARQIAKYLTSRGCSVYDNCRRFVSSSSYCDLECTSSVLSSERTLDHLCSEIGKRPSSSQVFDFEPRNDVVDVRDNDEQEVSDDEGSFCSILGQSYDGYSCSSVSDSQSSDDLNNLFSNGNSVNSRQTDLDIAYPAYSQFASENGKEMGCLPESSSQLNESHFFFYDRSADWDVKYGDSQFYQGKDSVHGGYYSTGEQVLSNNSYFNASFESDDAISGGLDFDNDIGVQGNSSSTWWDEDAVLVGNQEHEEDSMEQAWQVV